MKFWKKLTLVFIAIAILSTILGIGMLCVRARIFIMHEIANTALSVASSAAVIIDPEKVRKLEGTWDENSPEYKEIQNQFRMIRDQNRNAVFYVKYIYFLWHSPVYPDYLLFGVDAEENPGEFSSFGDYYAFEDTEDLLAHFNEGYAPLRFSHDPWGIWLSGYAPIFDQNGNVLGIVGVDVPERIFLEKWHKLFIFGSWAFFGSLAIAIYMALFFSKQITEPLSSLCETVKEIGKGNLKAKTHLHTHDEFNDLGVAIDEMAIGLQERDKIKTSLARYVSEPVMEKILAAKTLLKLEGERKKATVLFAGIKQFTPLSESLPAEEVTGILNSYFEKMLDVIFENSGTVDKLIGDRVLAEFGAPLDDPDQEKHAVKAALRMQEELKALSDQWEKEKKVRIEVGIGIHTGYTIVGNIGDEKRMEYTAIGDTVNVASRLQEATEIFKKPILVSDSCFEKIKEEFKYENLGPQEIRGRKEKITIYAVLPS